MHNCIYSSVFIFEILRTDERREKNDDDDIKNKFGGFTKLK